MTLLALPLAYAEATDLSGSDWPLILYSALALIVAFVLALVPMIIARRRNHRQTELVLAGALVWALVAAGSVIYALFTNAKWAKENLLLIKSGYYDPATAGAGPGWPWPLWVGLAVIYVALMVLVLWPRRSINDGKTSQ